MRLNDCRNGLSRNAGAQFVGVDAVRGVEVLGVGKLIKPLPHIGDKGVVFLSGTVVCLGHAAGHLVIVPALGRQFVPAFLIGPGGVENGDGSIFRICSQSSFTLEKKRLGVVIGPWLISWSTT